MNAWDVFWFIFVFLPLTILWIVTLLDMMGRPDLFGWQKAIWAAVIIFFPWIGIFAYLIMRPRGKPESTYTKSDTKSDTKSETSAGVSQTSSNA
jgi:hypothetical protein